MPLGCAGLSRIGYLWSRLALWAPDDHSPEQKKVVGRSTLAQRRFADAPCWCWQMGAGKLPGAHAGAPALRKMLCSHLPPTASGMAVREK